MFSASKEIRKIQQHCRNIRWIYTIDVERVNPTLSECIVSYGEQLEYAFLADMNQSELEAIVTACPNATFNISAERTNHSHSMEIVGSRLGKVVLFEFGTSNSCSVAKGCNACSNVEEVSLLGEVSLSYVQAMFAELKPALFEMDL